MEIKDRGIMVLPPEEGAAFPDARFILRRSLLLR
jgi:hypothetical protein